jgi:hypothetical protein
MTTTARVTPDGIKLTDGYQCLIAFAENTDIALWEKTVKPPGIEGGDAVDITTQHNEEWRTSAPRSLKTLTPIQVTAAYDPAVFESILDMVNVVQWITLHWPDGSTYDFVGYLKTFEPAALAEGTQPEATVTIVPTNELDGEEEAPVYTPSSGS